jgi:sigma-B regulation protein RsbU (phosphoserine phosphatase)
MGEVRQGNLRMRFKEEALGFEINILGSRFNAMIDTLLFNMERAEDERVKKETYQREVEICRDVQKSLLSFQMPSMESVHINAFYLPAVDVGADYYYFFSKTTQEKEKVLALIVADVIGRGISPCLYALSARSLLRAYSTLHDDVGTILRLTNNDFINDMGGTTDILNLCLGLYHVKSRILSYCLCGGVMGIVKKKNGRMTMLMQTGALLGSEQLYNYQSESIQLDSGDTLILYTKGLFKMINPQHNQFSEQQLEDIVQSQQWYTSQDFINTLTTTVQEFTQGIPQEEEAVVVALKVD